jgi:serine/threonine protein kinase
MFNTGYAPEVEPLKLMKHSNICRLEEDFPNEVTGGVFVLDIIPGKVLKDVLQESKGTLIPKKELFTWFCQMASALKFLAEEAFVLHCDLHDENWRVRESDGQLVLLDFTTGRVIGKDGCMDKSIPFSLTGRMFNPIASAPEQIAQESYGFPAEVWWFAAIMSCMANPQRNYCWEYPDTKFADMRTEPMTNAALYVEIMT